MGDFVKSQGFSPGVGVKKKTTQERSRAIRSVREPVRPLVFERVIDEGGGSFRREGVARLFIEKSEKVESVIARRATGNVQESAAWGTAVAVSIAEEEDASVYESTVTIGREYPSMLQMEVSYSRPHDHIARRSVFVFTFGQDFVPHPSSYQVLYEFDVLEQGYRIVLIIAPDRASASIAWTFTFDLIENEGVVNVEEESTVRIDLNAGVGEAMAPGDTATVTWQGFSEADEGGRSGDLFTITVTPPQYTGEVIDLGSITGAHLASDIEPIFPVVVLPDATTGPRFVYLLSDEDVEVTKGLYETDGLSYSLVRGSVLAKDVVAETLSAVAGRLGQLLIDDVLQIDQDGYIVQGVLIDNVLNTGVAFGDLGGLGSGIVGANGGVVQFQLSAGDGKFYAGGGNVVMDALGMDVASGAFTVDNTGAVYAGQLTAVGTLQGGGWPYGGYLVHDGGLFFNFLDETTQTTYSQNLFQLRSDASSTRLEVSGSYVGGFRVRDYASDVLGRNTLQSEDGIFVYDGLTLQSSLNGPDVYAQGTVAAGAFSGDGSALSGVDASTLGGYDASGFWRKAEDVDADTLDGYDSADFWRKAEDVDANTVGGFNSASLWKTTDNVNASFLEGVAKAGYWQKTESVNAATLGGYAPHEHWRKAEDVDAATLDGYDSADFWRKAESVDAYTLDSYDSSAFWRKAEDVDANTVRGDSQVCFYNLDSIGGGSPSGGSNGDWKLDIDFDYLWFKINNTWIRVV